MSSAYRGPAARLQYQLQYIRDRQFVLRVRLLASVRRLPRRVQRGVRTRTPRELMSGRHNATVPVSCR